MSFRDRTAVVTGASSGLGRALAVALARAGARVGVTARRADALAELVREVRSGGGTIEAVPADVADRPGLTAAVGELAARLGPVDLLVANAGVARPSAAGPGHADAVEAMTRVNFLGVVYSFQAAMGSMLERGSGHLVAVSSLAAFKGLPGAAGYCATKAAVNAYCEGLRIELRPRGVAVTCVCPGFVDTAMTATNPRPMPMLLTPDEAARRVLVALRRRPGVFAFPWPMRVLMWAARWAPDRFIRKRVPIGVAEDAQPGLPPRRGGGE